ncbi:MAG TPA: hypothetical protein PLC89_18715 [Haliscomenobacter sp.]|uniref:hypothetical protein n=1 Tax=Haliscomenobacter sp. TaxID=2717303 RepID=UPI002C88DDE3|nr:hypothetical protein [Haliscomenobacter sp.]HOY19349.1 hypothetical protein [Haliscomenobacter sp.]HPH19021.1 hypothetical protein [Haliscomenobacter sp.]
MFGVLVRKRSELKFVQVKSKKRSLAALNENFWNEAWANLSHLQREAAFQTHSNAQHPKKKSMCQGLGGILGGALPILALFIL